MSTSKIRKDTKMKAIVYTKYGLPDVLQLNEVEKPTPKDNEVLVKIYVGVVWPAACTARKGDPFIIRYISGLISIFSHGLATLTCAGLGNNSDEFIIKILHEAGRALIMDSLNPMEVQNG
jgi:hypothetical protein